MVQLQTDLEEAVRTRNFVRLRDALDNLPPSDIANLISETAPENRVFLFRVLPRELSADTFEYLPHEIQDQLLKSLGQEEVAAILNEMAPDDRTMLLEELPGAVTSHLLALLDP